MNDDANPEGRFPNRPGSWETALPCGPCTDTVDGVGKLSVDFIRGRAGSGRSEWWPNSDLWHQYCPIFNFFSFVFNLRVVSIRVHDEFRYRTLGWEEVQSA